jgi:hypothetical protein
MYQTCTGTKKTKKQTTRCTKPAQAPKKNKKKQTTRCTKPAQPSKKQKKKH